MSKNSVISALAAILFLMVSISVQATVYYDIDFESPVHIPDFPPKIGSGPDTPSSIVFGSPQVVQSFGAINSQCLLFDTGGQIELRLRQNQKFYHLSFDVLTENLDNSFYAFTIFFDTPSVQAFRFHGTGGVSLGGMPLAGSTFYGYDYSDNTLMHVEANINLLYREWNLEINNQLVVEGGFNYDSGDIHSIRFSLAPWSGQAVIEEPIRVAVDNILVANEIPEPATLCLFAVGILCLRRRRKSSHR